MKRNIYFLLLSLLSTCIASAQERKTSNFTLKGTFIGKHAHTISLFYKNDCGKRIEQKAYIKNGIFSIRGFISSPVYAGIMSDIKITPNSPDVSNFIDVFLSPGNMTIALKENNFEHAVLTGSPVQDEWVKLQTSYKPVNGIKDSLYMKLFAIDKTGITPRNHNARVAVVREIDKYDRQIDQIDYHYISSHPQSYISAYLLNNFVEVMRLDSIKMFYNALSQAVKKSVEGKAVNKIIIERRKAIVGSVVKMPSGINLNGSRFNPKTFKINNYLILYFWADWANDNTDLKAIYYKYQSQGLKVLAISMDPFKKMWRDSVKKDRIGMWYNIFSGLSANLDIDYNIRQTPPSLILLVDKSHTIIGRYRGHDDLYKMDYDEEPLSELDLKLAGIINK
jgi:hypothetical protein